MFDAGVGSITYRRGDGGVAITQPGNSVTPSTVVVIQLLPSGPEVLAGVGILPIRSAVNERGREPVGPDGDRLDAHRKFPGDRGQAIRVRVLAVGVEHGVGVEGGKHIREEHPLTLGPMLVDHGLQRGAVFENIRRVGGILVGVRRRAPERAGLDQDDIGIWRIGVQEVQEARHVIGRHGIRVAPAADVVDPDVHAKQIRRVRPRPGRIIQAVRDAVIQIHVRAGVAMDERGLRHPGLGDDGTAISFIQVIGEPAGGRGHLPAHGRKGKVIGSQELFEVKAPGVLMHTIIGDRIADVHDLDRAGRAEIVDHQLSVRRQPPGEHHQTNHKPNEWMRERLTFHLRPSLTTNDTGQFNHPENKAFHGPSREDGFDRRLPLHYRIK